MKTKEMKENEQKPQQSKQYWNQMKTTQKQKNKQIETTATQARGWSSRR